MVAIAKGGTTDVSNPLLTFYLQDEGFLVDPLELSFQVFDQTTEAKRASPVQVFPATLGHMQPVDLDIERLGLGRYAPTWTAPATVGRYGVRWFWRLSGGAERSARQVFEVLNGEPLGGPAYALVSDLRGDCGDSDIPESRLQMGILTASSLIQNVTARFFEPRYAPTRHDGTGGRALLLNDPIIAIESISVDERVGPDPSVVDLTDVRVYNRHVSQRMTNPDDRDNPRVEFRHGRDMFGRHDFYEGRPAWFSSFGFRHFPTGVQNVIVPGVYGFTEWDGTPFGKTPEMIQHITRQLALRNIPNEEQCRESVKNGWRVIEERTRDQMIRYADPRKFGQWTGDADIDSVLASYVRPLNLGSA